MTPDQYQARIATRTKAWVGEPFIRYLKAEPKEIFSSAPSDDDPDTFRYWIRDPEVLYDEIARPAEQSGSIVRCVFETVFDVDKDGIIKDCTTAIRLTPIKQVKFEKNRFAGT